MFNDISPGNYDAPSLGFIGGAKIHSSQASGAPIGTGLPAGTPKWGMGWKEGMEEWYGHSMKLSITTTCMSYRDVYLDLDPNYTDKYGLPLLRMTFNWQKNELKLQQYLKKVVNNIADEMKPDSRTQGYLSMDDNFDITEYVSTHNVGGAVAIRVCPTT